MVEPLGDIVFFVLAERDDELRCLDEALDRAVEGRGSVVLVYGEAGIGKSSLLREFADRTGEKARIRYGACEDLSIPRLLGAFADMLGGSAGQAGPDRDRYLDLLLGELAQAGRPLVLMVDDAHWADDASLDIVRYIGRRITDLRGVLVLAYRPELAAAHPLQRILGALAGPPVNRLPLRPLSDRAVTEIAQSAGRDAPALVAAVGGNPFFLAEALAAPDHDIPATVRDAVLGRVLALPEVTRQALERLSVFPSGARRDLLEAVCGAGALRALVAADRVNIVVTDGGTTRFRHELARRAVESSLPAAARIELHRAALDALTARDTPPSVLAHHAAGADDPARLTRYAVVAAEQAAAAEAHHETADFGRIALDHSELLDRRTEARLHGHMAHALYALNRFGDAAEHAGRAVDMWTALADSPLELGRVLLVASRMHTMRGRPEDARAEIIRAMGMLEPLGPSSALAYSYGMLGNLEMVEANCEPAVQWCRRALAMARDLDLPDVEAHARIYLGAARVGLGDPGGLDDMRAAIDIAAAIDHGDFLCRATTNLATAMIWRGRHPEVTPYLDLAESAAREHGLDLYLFHVLANRSHVDLYAGRWDHAERRLRSLLATDRDPAALMVLPLALLGKLLARRGDPGARELIGRAWTLATRSRQAHRLALAGSAVIEHAWLSGDRGTVISTATLLEPVARRTGLTYLLGESRRYLLRVGEPATTFADCPPGFAAGITGDHIGASAVWAAAGNPYERALEEVESDDPAVTAAGVRRLDELGAAAAAAVSRRQLRSRGMAGIPRGRRSGAKADPHGLTPRQREILALLGDGLTTPQIARRLVLSPRTVDNHVAAIVERLGVHGRLEAVAAVRRPAGG